MEGVGQGFGACAGAVIPKKLASSSASVEGDAEAPNRNFWPSAESGLGAVNGS